MSRICHEHCPTSEGAGWFWLVVLVAAAAGVLWLLGELLSGLGKPVMIVILVVALTVTAGVIVAGIAARSAAAEMRPSTFRPPHPRKRPRRHRRPHQRRRPRTAAAAPITRPRNHDGRGCGSSVTTRGPPDDLQRA